MSWMRAKNPKARWLRDVVDFFGDNLVLFGEWAAEKGVKTVPYGRIILGGLGLSAALMLLSLGVISRGYYDKIHLDQNLDRQKALFEQQLEQQQKTIRNLEERVQAREKLESEMLAMMGRYGSPLSEAQRADYADFVIDEARRLSLDPMLAFSLIAVESGFDPGAVSNRGAVGMAQLRPFVAKAFAEQAGVYWRGESTLRDPIDNTRIGLFYLTTLQEQFDSIELALEAYNHGPAGLIRKINAGDPPTEYSAKVLTVASAFNV